MQLLPFNLSFPDIVSLLTHPISLHFFLSLTSTMNMTLVDSPQFLLLQKWAVEKLRSRRLKTRQTGRSLTPREETVFSRKLKNLLFFVTLRSLSSCYQAPGSIMSTQAQTLRMLCSQHKKIYFIEIKKRFNFFFPIRTKKMIDQYQSALGVDIWSIHYEV